MNNYLLESYALSKLEIAQSLIVSEYGLRHLAESKRDEKRKWGHRVIAIIELCPVIGIVPTVIEGLRSTCIRSDYRELSLNGINRSILKVEDDQNLNFQNLFDEEWLFKGSQFGHQGKVLISDVKAICAQLNNCRPNKIHFNHEKVTDSIDGGTCTAMSLEFLNFYFKAKHLSQSSKGNHAYIFINNLLNDSSQLMVSSIEMRYRQAAFNTIEVEVDEGSANGVDYSKNKVQALANYHLFSVDYASKEIDIEKLEEEDEFREILKNFPEGAFFIRMIKPLNNERLEEFGHSLIYIKEKGIAIFYDPNFGARNLYNLDHAKVLFEAFKNCFQVFGVHLLRFYRIKS